MVTSTMLMSDEAERLKLALLVVVPMWIADETRWQRSRSISFQNTSEPTLAPLRCAAVLCGTGRGSRVVAKRCVITWTWLAVTESQLPSAISFGIRHWGN